MRFGHIKDFDKNLEEILFKSEAVKEKAAGLRVLGSGPWELKITADWQAIGDVSIESASLYDHWAIKEWYLGLSAGSRNFLSIFPVDNRIDKYISMHLKKNFQRACMIFNLFKDDEIIGHFFVSNIEQKPEMALGVADKYQRNKLGHLFLAIMMGIFKIYKFERIYLTTMHENRTAYSLYKKLGFELTGDTKVDVPGFDYKTDEYAMFIRL